MEIEVIEGYIPDFSQEVLRDFETTQEEFKSITVQKVFEIVEKRSNAKDLMPLTKEAPFWERVHSNVHLFRERVMNEIKQFEGDFNKQSKIDYFFVYLDENTK
ncbi:MAG: hypothetical protein ACM31G_11605 [Flavobacteriales bacterium]